MIYWLANYLNYHGYYFDGYGYCYYVSNQSGYYSTYNWEYVGDNQQPCLTRSQRRKKRRAKKKAAINSNKNGLEGAKKVLKSQETKSQPVKAKEPFADKECANGLTIANRSVIQKESGCKGEILATSSNTNCLNQNLIESQVNPAIDVKQISPEKKCPKQISKLPDIQQNETPKETRNKFSVSDPNTPEYIQLLAEAFNSEISLMQSRLTAESVLKPIHDDNDLMVAEIHVENNPQISDAFFEFIRTELVGWIGVYQQQGMSTPIFHKITKNDCYLTVVCDNKYAYECVERCIEDLAQTKTIGPLKVLTLPPITSIIYCFDAEYEGIASDPDLFLSQLRFHKPKLYTNDWLLVSHEVCSDKCRTYFIFLVDERSALALNFQYNSHFYICMQQVTFHNRGILTNSI